MREDEIFICLLAIPIGIAILVGAWKMIKYLLYQIFFTVTKAIKDGKMGEEKHDDI